MLSKVKSVRPFSLAILSLFIAVIFIWSLIAMADSEITSDFTSLNATQLVTAMGAGWNLGNQMEATIDGIPSENAWGNPIITQALITKVKSLGFKTIRIPISYLKKIGSAPDYTIESSWLSRIKEVVDYAYKEELYVIINMHGDGYNSITGAWLLCNSSDQTTIKAKYQKVWQQIANTFVDYDEHLIFESMNEEFDGTYGTPNTTYYSNLNAYNQIFVDTVRQTGGNNSARWLLIPGWNTNIDYTAGDYGFVLPTDNYRSATIPSDEKRIMISAHYYSPWDFCGDNSGTITQWGATADDSSRTSTWGQEDYMESQIKLMRDKFVTQGYPVVIGEWGSVDKTSADSTNNTYRAIFAKTLCAYCKQYGAVPVYWDNGYNGAYGFGLLDRNNLTVAQQGIITAIMGGIDAEVEPSATSTPSSSPATTPNQTATPTATVIVTSTPAVTVASTATPATSSFAVSYVQNDWGSGATVSIIIKNTGTAAVDGWKLTFSFAGNQKITNLWCGTYNQSGTEVTVTNASYNGAIPAGGTVNFGFNISYSDMNTKPTNFTVNGVAATTY